jgi:hypothetical protein
LVSPGLYQINVEVPELPAGEYDIVVSAQGTRTQQRAMLLVGQEPNSGSTGAQHAPPNPGRRSGWAKEEPRNQSKRKEA